MKEIQMKPPVYKDSYTNVPLVTVDILRSRHNAK